MNDLPTFESMLAGFGETTELGLRILKQNTQPRSFLRGELLVEPGDVCKKLFIIQKGIVRGYISSGQKDTTTWLTAEGEMVTAIRSFILQVPTEEKVQALEDCEVLEIDYDDLQRLYIEFIHLNIIGRKILEQYYCDAEERAYIIRLVNAPMKYEYFLKTKGHLINRVPLKFIASYLGMTTETLSRIRTKFSRKKYP